MKPLFFLFSLLTLLTASNSCNAPETDQANALEKLYHTFTYQPESTQPLVSAHRGGPSAGYPENALATFQQTNRAIPSALLELDISMSKDSVLLLMHDNTVDRTTNGTGKVSELTWEQLSELNLVDEFGKETTHKIPTLAEVLSWAKGKALLSLDVKRGVPFDMVVKHIAQYDASANVMVIVYNLEDAKLVHQLNEDLLISANIRNEEELAKILASVPARRIVAFTGTSAKSPAFYELIHREGIRCIIGTMGNLDKSAMARGDKVYEELLSNGADIIATDRPLEVWETMTKLSGL